MAVIKFNVRGIPIPQGSAKALPRRGGGFPIITHANPKTKGWRAQVTSIAQEYAPAKPFEGAIYVQLDFILPRPAYLRKIPKRGPIKPEASMTKRPDLDKLVRAIFDAITGVIILDDSQITLVVASKRYDYLEAPGVRVKIEEVPQ